MKNVEKFTEYPVGQTVKYELIKKKKVMKLIGGNLGKTLLYFLLISIKMFWKQSNRGQIYSILYCFIFH